jgi:DNA repair photolyase
MSTVSPLTPIAPNVRGVTNLPGLEPQVVDRDYLTRLGVSVRPSSGTLAALTAGSRNFAARLAAGNLIPRSRVRLTEIDLGSELEIHNYTGACPVLTYEVSPVQGCYVGCLYCLVTDGVHEQELTAYSNYDQLVARFLAEKHGERHYYYYSAKTEAFQEPTLQTGIAHNILRVFIEHFRRTPGSQARIFVASKAGLQHLQVRHQGESILDLFAQLKGRMQFNTSVSIMPDHLRDAIEPFGAPLADRLAAVKACRDAGIMSNSALVQPIIAPYLTDENMHAFFAMLRDAGIVNYKPEFLTACMENLAMLGQLQGYYDKDLERRIYECYIAPENSDHKKQRGRTAPNRELCQAVLKRMVAISEQYGLSISICYWVREQLGITTEAIPLVNRNGFQCLGYQRRLFPDHDPAIENNPRIKSIA